MPRHLERLPPFRNLVILAIIISALSTTSFTQETNPLFVVIVNNKRGFIDKKGTMVIQPKFQGARDFSDGLAAVAVSDDGYKEGYIDQSGQVVIEPKWDWAGAFNEGVAWVGIDQAKRAYKIGNRTFCSSPSDSFDYKFGLIDKAGKYIVEPSFTSVSDFSGGLAAVKTKDDKFGFIDKSGKIVIGATFDWAGGFSEGLAPVYVHRKYGFINTLGQIVIKPRFAMALGFSEGLACVKVGGRTREPFSGMMQTITTTTISDTNYAYIDKTGKIAFNLKASEAHSFSEGLARFEVFGNYGEGFIDKAGKVIIQPIYGGQSDFSEGMKFVILDKGDIGFIDKRGRLVLKPNFALANDFKNGLASVQDSLDTINVKYGYIDRTGKVIWEPTK